jgi:hypothetical protein
VIPGYITPYSTPQLSLSERPQQLSGEWNSFIPSWLEQVAPTSEPEVLLEERQQPLNRSSSWSREVPDMAFSSMMAPTPLSTAPAGSASRSRRLLGLDRRQNYLQQLRSEIRSLKSRRAQTRDGIETVIDILYRGLDGLSTQQPEDVEHHFQEAIDALVSLLPDLPPQDAASTQI